MDHNARKVIKAYKRQGARTEVRGRAKLKNRKAFSLWYTPGVGAAADYLAKHPREARKMSIKRNSVAVISDGSAVLGLGNIGPYGALPVMEGKALIFKELANIDAWPIVLNTQDTDEIVRTIEAIAPAFGGVNLEDISAPRCFEIERRLIESLDIPVMHDDQHGTAVVVLAGLLNAAKVVKKDFKKLAIAIIGAGAAGTATAELLHAAGNHRLVVFDREGAIYRDRPGLSSQKQKLALFTNPQNAKGDVQTIARSADVVIGLSGGGTITRTIVANLAPRGIVFALANPAPEIMPNIAKEAGAAVIATGRSDFPNQLNNALVYPGIFRGALDKGVKKITQGTKLRAAHALAELVPRPTAAKIIPDLLDKRVVKTIAKSVR